MTSVTGDQPPRVDVDPRYVVARRVLIDALSALAPYGPAVIVAGAQAIYLRTGAADLSIAPYTTDADITLDPASLADAPTLEATMTGAGFVLSSQADGHNEPGVWIMTAVVDGIVMTIPVDLIVPEGVSGPGRRGARLHAHGNRAARRALGLEAALVDHDSMTVSALDPADRRSIEAEVAGAAALFVAKAHKLRDRVETSNRDRLVDKDAADVVRLMQTTSPATTGASLARLSRDSVAGQPTIDALAYLEQLFGRRGRQGIEMAARALQLSMPEAAVELLCTSYVAELLKAAADPTP